jgi:hypothetical protein
MTSDDLSPDQYVALFDFSKPLISNRTFSSVPEPA